MKSLVFKACIELFIIPNSKNVIAFATLRIVTIEKPELAFLLISYFFPWYL